MAKTGAMLNERHTDIKGISFNKKCLRISWEKVRRMDHQQKNDKTERARGPGRKNNRGDRKGESNDSPEIPDRR